MSTTPTPAEMAAEALARQHLRCTYCLSTDHRASHCPMRSAKIVRTETLVSGVVKRRHVSAAGTLFTTWDDSRTRPDNRGGHPKRAVCEEYLRAGGTPADVARAFGVSVSTVRSWA